MSAPRTTHTLRVRSYEIRPDGRAGNASFLNWFQEAAFANSTALGFGLEQYQAMGVTWVMRESELEIVERPRYNESIAVTTWIADFQRVTSWRQYEARRTDGTLLARCSTLWAMLSLATLRPTRIPEVMRGIFDPAQDFVLEAAEWPEIEGEGLTSTREVSFFEEDELAHVNNAVYLNWVEESARRAAVHAGLPIPTFTRHRLLYRLPARSGDSLTLRSAHAPHGDTRAWLHEVWRGEELLLRANSLSE